MPRRLEAEETSEKTTLLIAAGRPVPHLQEVTEAAMRVVQCLRALIERGTSVKTADIAFLYSPTPCYSRRLNKQATRKKNK